MKKNYLIKLFILTLITSLFLMFYGVAISAHSTSLNVTYDECVPVHDGDGDHEKWYALEKYSLMRHIPNDTKVLKYFISESGDVDIMNKM